MTKLRKQSESRVKKSADLQEVVSAIDQLTKRKQEEKVTLVEADFAKQWKESTGKPQSEVQPRNSIVKDYH